MYDVARFEERLQLAGGRLPLAGFVQVHQHVGGLFKVPDKVGAGNVARARHGEL